MTLFEKNRLSCVEIFRSSVVVLFIIGTTFFSLLPPNEKVYFGSFDIMPRITFFSLANDLFNGLCVFLFCCTICHSLLFRLNDGNSVLKEFLHLLKISLILLGLDIFYALFLAPLKILPFSKEISGGFLPRITTFNDFSLPPIEQLFQGGFFSLIAISLFCVVALVIILFKICKKIRLNLLFPLLVIGIFWIIFLSNLSGFSRDTAKMLFERGGIARLLSFLLYNYGGRNFAIVGILPYGIFGAIFALQIVKSKNIKEFREALLFHSLLFFGIILFFLGTIFVSIEMGEGSIFASIVSHTRLLILVSILAIFLILGFLAIKFDLSPVVSEKIFFKPVFARFRVLGKIFLTIYLWDSFACELFVLIASSLSGGIFRLFNSEPNNLLFVALYFVFIGTFWALFFLFAKLFKYRGTVESVTFDIICGLKKILSLLTKKERFKLSKNEKLSAATIDKRDLSLFYLDI